MIHWLAGKLHAQNHDVDIGFIFVAPKLISIEVRITVNIPIFAEPFRRKIGIIGSSDLAARAVRVLVIKGQAGGTIHLTANV